MNKLLLTLGYAAFIGYLGYSGTANAQSMTPYETEMVRIAQANHELNRVTAAYSRCASTKMLYSFITLSGCLARHGVVEKDDVPVVPNIAPSCLAGHPTGKC
jgi:hypothetical protein